MPLDALSYHAFRDQNMVGNEANQPALSPDDIIRRIALTPGATFRPGEFEALMQLAQQAQAQQAQRDEIDQFYQSPDREADINRAVDPLEQQGFAGLVEKLRGQSRQGAFSRARSGNIGGSVQASQQAQLAGQGAAQGAQLAAGFEGQRDMLRQALEAARVQETLGTYNMDPQLQQSIEQRVRTFGVQGDTNAALEALRRQREQQTDFQNDEFSRALGNTVNVGSQMYQTHQNQEMGQDYQNFLASLRNRQTAGAPVSMGPGGTY